MASKVRPRYAGSKEQRVDEAGDERPRDGGYRRRRSLDERLPSFQNLDTEPLPAPKEILHLPEAAIALLQSSIQQLTIKPAAAAGLAPYFTGHHRGSRMGVAIRQGGLNASVY